MLSMKKTIFASLIVMIAAAVVVGCKNDNNATTQPASTFGVVNASPDAGTLDVYMNGAPLVRSLMYGADTGYFTVYPGTYTLSFADSASTTSLLDQSVSFSPGVTYSVFAIDSVSHLQTAVVMDSVSAPSDDSVATRFLNFSPNAPALDLAINGNVVFSGRNYNDVAANPAAARFSYLTAGTYTLELRAAGTPTVLYTTSVTISGGKIYTFYAQGFAGETGTSPLTIGTLVHNE